MKKSILQLPMHKYYPTIVFFFRQSSVWQKVQLNTVLLQHARGYLFRKWMAWLKHNRLIKIWMKLRQKLKEGF